MQGVRRYEFASTGRPDCCPARRIRGNYGKCLVIPDTAKEKPQQGEVLAVGPGKRSEQTGELIPVDVEVGDTVVYAKYGGTEISSGGEELLILSARDVLAIVK